MSVAPRVYVLFAPGRAYFDYSVETIFFQKNNIVRSAAKQGLSITFDVISPSGYITDTMRRMRLKHLEDVQGGKFEAVLLRGECMTPYIGAILHTAHRNTSIINEAEIDSPLDYCSRMIFVAQLSSAEA